jgi:hypothetical protein
MYFEFDYIADGTCCLIFPTKKGGPLLAIGIAYRHPLDQPNKRKGRNLAAARAIRALVPGDRRDVLQERRLAWEALRAQGVRV